MSLLLDGARPGGEGWTSLASMELRLVNRSNHLKSGLIAELSSSRSEGSSSAGNSGIIEQMQATRVLQGFLVEQAGLEGAVEISSYGGWRPYIATLNVAARVRRSDLFILVSLGREKAHSALRTTEIDCFCMRSAGASRLLDQRAASANVGTDSH